MPVRCWCAHVPANYADDVPNGVAGQSRMALIKDPIASLPAVTSDHSRRHRKWECQSHPTCGQTLNKRGCRRRRGKQPGSPAAVLPHHIAFIACCTPSYLSQTSAVQSGTGSKASRSPASARHNSHRVPRAAFAPKTESPTSRTSGSAAPTWRHTEAQDILKRDLRNMGDGRPLKEWKPVPAEVVPTLGFLWQRS
jgi:hypothetical protein